MSNRKSLNPKLPGAFGKMTAAELDAAVAKYDEPGVADREARAVATRGERPAHRATTRGRKPKPAGEKFDRVLFTLPPTLVDAFDALPATRASSRSTHVAKLMQAAVDAGSRRGGGSASTPVPGKPRAGRQVRL